MVEITQADRKAAARLVSKMGDTIRALNIMCGNLDDAPEVQAFAAHRIAERERCARVNCEALKAQMEAQADDTTPSSIQREKGLVWLEGWFDMKAALRAIAEPGLVELERVTKYAQHGRDD